MDQSNYGLSFISVVIVFCSYASGIVYMYQFSGNLCVFEYSNVFLRKKIQYCRSIFGVHLQRVLFVHTFLDHTLCNHNRRSPWLVNPRFTCNRINTIKRTIFLNRYVFYSISIFLCFLK